jgi:hypothetical protein
MKAVRITLVATNIIRRAVQSDHKQSDADAASPPLSSSPPLTERGINKVQESGSVCITLTRALEDNMHHDGKHKHHCRPVYCIWNISVGPCNVVSWCDGNQHCHAGRHVEHEDSSAIRMSPTGMACLYRYCMNITESRGEKPITHVHVHVLSPGFRTK